MEYSWRKDPDNPIRIDQNGMMTIVVEELIDNKSQKPKMIRAVDVPADVGTYEQIWAEAQRRLKIQIAPTIQLRRDQAAARAGITDEMVADLEQYLNTEEV